MEAVRTIIDPEKLKGIVDIPKNMEQSKLELIILPVEGPEGDSKGISAEEKGFADLYRNPIKVDRVKKFSKEQLHER